MSLFVTGGAGFIDGKFVLDWIAGSEEMVVNFDKLTCASNLQTLASFPGNSRYIFVQGNIGDRDLMGSLLAENQPRAVINFAAESHLDRPIHGPRDFIETNSVGTYNLHVSTDEVYGSLAKDDLAFAETKRYEPDSPYSDIKAVSDHLVRAWNHPYRLPVPAANCSNNLWALPLPREVDSADDRQHPGR